MLIKFFLSISILFLFSHANLTYVSNHAKEIDVLESFDIDASFLYDPIMNQMRAKLSGEFKDRHFFQAMDDAYLFIPEVKKILADYGIPAEFLFLAMAESNFSNRAYSKKRAAGLWQFMPQTALLSGLKIDEYVDERRDLVKSTEAAAKYLSSLYKMFGKWYLAAIAYNCGGGRLSSAIKKAKSDDLAVLADEERKFIPKESRYYIRKIVALALMGNDETILLRSEYEHLLNRANAYSVSKVHLPRGESLNRVAKLIGVPAIELKKLNRHLKYDFLPPYKEGYEIYIPYIKLSEFKQKYKESNIQSIYMVHVVSKGDNLYYLGKKYNVSYKVIKDFNNLKTSHLRLNQKLIIPIEGNRQVKRVESKNYYMVKAGDTLESISKLYKISIQNIKLQNGMRTSAIKEGDRLKIYE